MTYLADTTHDSLSSATCVRRPEAARVRLSFWTSTQRVECELTSGHAIVVGRGAGADLLIDDATVSRHHARVAFDGVSVTVEDLGSRNGVWLGNQRVPSAVLDAGSHAMLGDVTLVAHRQRGQPEDLSPLASASRSLSLARSKSFGPPASTAMTTLLPLECGEAAPLCATAEMLELSRTLRKVAPLPVPVLVLGETGSGKEGVAREVHARSPRANRALVVVNCAAIPATLIESTLFGHLRGAFSGADQARVGLFEAADGGTLFLDEVGELSLAAQAALLRVLETRRIVRVGAHQETQIDVRVVAATHRDLRAMTEASLFRLDLFHRLNTVTLSVPPLRARPHAIRSLACFFLRSAATELNVERLLVDETFFAACQAYSWPGNVRELKNVALRAAALADGRPITQHDLPAEISAGRLACSAPTRARESGTQQANVEGVSACDLKQDLKQREREAIAQALDQAGGNKRLAADLLRIPLRTFHRRVKEMRLIKD